MKRQLFTQTSGITLTKEDLQKLQTFCEQGDGLFFNADEIRRHRARQSAVACGFGPHREQSKLEKLQVVEPTPFFFAKKEVENAQ